MKRYLHPLQKHLKSTKEHFPDYIIVVGVFFGKIMKIYMAPMEGITGYIYRNAYNKNFTPLDKYFTPFIQNKGLSSREKEDILPEHNAGMKVVPQVLSGDTDTFFEICRQFHPHSKKSSSLFFQISQSI